MTPRFVPMILGAWLLLGVAPSLSAQSRRDWDLGVSSTNRAWELEVSYLPLLSDFHPGGFFTGAKASAAFLDSRERGRESGMRFHLDFVGGDRPWYVQAGPFLAAGQDLGVGVGLRLGGGYRFISVFRAGLVADVAGGTHGSMSSLGLQASFTF